jgi:hypothetical protein
MNAYGQLGDGTTTNRTNPVTVTEITTATTIAASGAHTCAVLSDGTIRCWGSNQNGQLGDGTTTARLTPVPVVGVTGATGIDAGVDHTCARLADGTVRCWGGNQYGQLGDGTTTSRLIPVRVGGITTATGIAAGNGQSCALLADGSVRCWGANLGAGYPAPSLLAPVPVAGLTTATAITALYEHTCALLADGTVRCWGDNSHGQLGDGTMTSASVTGNPTSVAVAGITTATAIAGGWWHTCAVLADLTTRCWGENEHGQLGDGTTTDRLTQVPVVGISTATTVTGGVGHSCVLLVDASVRCWGWNQDGQLGDRTTTNRVTPAEVRVWDVDPPTATIASPLSPTNAASLVYTITFSEPVWGHSWAPYTLTGTATGCSGGNPAGTGVPYTVTVTGCSDGSLTLSLLASAFSDQAGNRGPPTAVTAATVVIDRTAPVTSVPTVQPRPGSSLTGSAIPVRVSWSGSDIGGTGVAAYELARSADGGRTWTTMASSLGVPNADGVVRSG